MFSYDFFEKKNLALAYFLDEALSAGAFNYFNIITGHKNENTDEKARKSITTGIDYVSFKHLKIASLKFIQLLQVVLSSQQRLNRPAVNAAQ